eukprot:maker-scaffold_3-snap-gene-17.3-mRNA-1 protein AED:0.03 eAED:0.03 QI:0/0/0.5/1/1/1/2/146/314
MKKNVESFSRQLLSHISFQNKNFTISYLKIASLQAYSRSFSIEINRNETQLESELIKKQKRFNSLFKENKLGSSESIKLSHEILNISETLFSKNHTVYASSLNNLAMVQRSSFLFDEAIRNFEQAYKIYKKEYDLENISTLTSLFNLALAYKSSAEYKSDKNEKLQLLTKSRENLELVLEVRKRSLGENNKTVANYMQILGRVKQSIHIINGQKTPDLDAYNDVIKGKEIIEAKCGKSLETALAMNNLGFYYKVAENFFEAELWFEKSLLMLEDLEEENRTIDVKKEKIMISVYRASGKIQEEIQLERILEYLD